MTKSVIDSIKLFLKTKTAKNDFQKFFLIKKATKTCPTIALMINPQTDENLELPDSKIIWSGLGVVIPEKTNNVFYESNNVVVDEFFKDYSSAKSFLKSLSEKEIQCEYEPKDSSYIPEEFDFDSDAEQAIENEGYFVDKVSAELENTFFEIYDKKLK